MFWLKGKRIGLYDSQDNCMCTKNTCYNTSMASHGVLMFCLVSLYSLSFVYNL